MRATTDRLERRARRLLRCYPQQWRASFGDEFSELLRSDLAERPRSLRRTADVARSGVLARLAPTGLTSRTLGPAEQLHASLATLGCALGAFLCFGAAMWAQLTIGWQWSAPDNRATTAAVVVMWAALLCFALLALLAAIPVLLALVRRATQRRWRGLGWAPLLLLLGSVLLVLGSHHFANGWPGTRGHPWAHQGLVPGGIAAFAWASTLSVSSYWAHPGALRAFPTAEVLWMATSPLALLCLVIGAARTVRRLELPARTLRYEARLGSAATLAMFVLLAGASCWIVDGGPGPKNLFHAGSIDVVAMVVMAGALAVACRAVDRATRGGLALLAR